VGICFNPSCPYYVRSLKWSTEHCQIPESYRHCYDVTTKTELPLRAIAADNITAFVPMGTHEHACKTWNIAVDDWCAGIESAEQFKDVTGKPYALKGRIIEID
jgi:hypothetical protein